MRFSNFVLDYDDDNGKKNDAESVARCKVNLILKTRALMVWDRYKEAVYFPAQESFPEATET